MSVSPSSSFSCTQSTMPRSASTLSIIMANSAGDGARAESRSCPSTSSAMCERRRILSSFRNPEVPLIVCMSRNRVATMSRGASPRSAASKSPSILWKPSRDSSTNSSTVSRSRSLIAGLPQSRWIDELSAWTSSTSS